MLHSNASSLQLLICAGPPNSQPQKFKSLLPTHKLWCAADTTSCLLCPWGKRQVLFKLENQTPVLQKNPTHRVSCANQSRNQQGSCDENCCSGLCSIADRTCRCSDYEGESTLCPSPFFHSPKRPELPGEGQDYSRPPSHNRLVRSVRQGRSLLSGLYMQIKF